MSNEHRPNTYLRQNSAIIRRYHCTSFGNIYLDSLRKSAKPRSPIFPFAFGFIYIFILRIWNIHTFYDATHNFSPIKTKFFLDETATTVISTQRVFFYCNHFVVFIFSETKTKTKNHYKEANQDPNINKRSRPRCHTYSRIRKNKFLRFFLYRKR